MKLEGSCHCGKVSFSLTSAHPYPYQRCYCSICRKTDGGGGYAINLGGAAASLKVEGREHIRIYHARIKNPEDERAHTSSAERHFCGACGAALWLFDPQWPELIHPFAAVIDTPLPLAPELTHIMLEFKPDWVPLERGPRDRVFDRYPEESIADWHARLGLADPA
ncbi:MAG: GFA family protein [Proteobacteria bacterium]|nr:GFA family protein [Pseudomonadota bacterium]